MMKVYEEEVIIRYSHDPKLFVLRRVEDLSDESMSEVSGSDRLTPTRKAGRFVL